MFNFAVVLSAVVASVSAQTWCNKNYMSSEPVVPPGGNFPTPASSTEPLLALRCAPVIRPYLAEDSQSPAGILIDAPVTYTQIAGAEPITLSSGSLAVTISANGTTLGTANVPLNATKYEIPFSLGTLVAQKDAYNISCTATYNNQSFAASTALSYLPDPTNSSVTKMDLRTGALMAKPANGKGGKYDYVFPIGFYTSFDGYLTSNLSVINDLKEQGFTVIHPVPTFSNLTALAEVLDRMEEVGMYFMYDMRINYMNATAVTEQVNMIKSRPNLLVWYTGDEPDGTADPLTATSTAYDLIYSLDGYHPVSLVLNCQDYQYTAYTSGTDIVMQDAYMIGNNVTYSNEWNNTCTPDFGDCGCDNCQGNFEDISNRMDEFKERNFINGWERTKAVWTVPQAFGGSEYWAREPTGYEWLVQSIIAVNHGGLGIIPWEDPTPADIKGNASALAKALPSMKPYIFSPNATFANLTSNQVDVGMWTVGGKTLLLAANMAYEQVTLKLPAALKGQQGTQVFDGGAAASGSGIIFQSTGTGAFVF
ncbi:hypothetical protein FIBSPDRAFT_916135 [Athelia psychrophila]|uniref:Glycoside hydrolase family 2 protein n=1 Tax=Athelia psychrophila TaxID=1759441 RepID=A0A166VXL1_9AGAM|nr:hypothetical protein FIBSPDRAFT_916135 [Fibularhizoctonia sp. CBS 109695]